MASTASNNPNPAHRHDNIALVASAAAAVAAGVVYKGVWFNVAGSADVVDLSGNLETVTGGIGSCYPLENYGVVTGGGTTLTQGQYLLIY